MIERSDIRERTVRAMLPLAAMDGWTDAVLARALQAAGEDPGLADSHFPDGPDGAIALWSDLADREMAAAGAAEGVPALRVPARIRRLVELRLTAAAPHKLALRRAFGRLLLRGRADLVAAITGRTVDAMWHAAGDTAADWNWYTKRASLAAVYAATLTWWLRDDDPELTDTLAFLDRRLADLARLGRRRR